MHEQLMALPVLVESIGGAGKVAEDLGPIFLQQFRYIIIVVFCPAVFAQEYSQFHFPASDGHRDRFYQVFDGHVPAQLRQDKTAKIRCILCREKQAAAA